MSLSPSLFTTDDLDESYGSARPIPQLDPPAMDEDSQMSFDASEFFQRNFNVSGGDAGQEYEASGDAGQGYEASGQYEDYDQGYVQYEGDMPTAAADIINNDLCLSDSEEEDEEEPEEGAGFDFDDFD